MLEYNGIAITVSTVGNMQDYRDSKKIYTIGYERYFETMVFHCEPVSEKNPWKDANVSRQIFFDSEWAIDRPWKEAEANEMHENVISEITAGLLAGNTYE